MKCERCEACNRWEEKNKSYNEAYDVWRKANKARDKANMAYNEAYNAYNKAYIAWCKVKHSKNCKKAK